MWFIATWPAGTIVRTRCDDCDHDYFVACSSLNEHVHLHVCVVDGVFVPVAGSVIFHPATDIDQAAVAEVQATLRRRILRAFVARSPLERSDAKEMLAYQYSGCSVDAGVCIEAHDRAAKAPAEVLCAPAVCYEAAARRGR